MTNAVRAAENRPAKMRIPSISSFHVWIRASSWLFASFPYRVHRPFASLSKSPSGARSMLNSMASSSRGFAPRILLSGMGALGPPRDEDSCFSSTSGGGSCTFDPENSGSSSGIIIFMNLSWLPSLGELAAPRRCWLSSTISMGPGVRCASRSRSFSGELIWTASTSAVSQRRLRVAEGWGQGVKIEDIVLIPCVSSVHIPKLPRGEACDEV
ncbi:hypothetical protein BC834DRAFT_907183 [Gloeopeniophorella convolvens]|nr:hypothetical protein BC834DRAFT_907183 [Gloeopeniophorella convolvens]